ncbi:MAG: aminotransferase class I/II-fold pyridoxal phosphate-dependent enzyme [Clostridiales bacterium]|nr:aminotransferase class I/II-fold pyridoxal phosphate-dependent enzyme [Clostridiales bacterium]
MHLTASLDVNVSDYIGIKCIIVLANPNAPTGVAVSLSDIERIAASNENNVVIIDEAYADFWGQSAISLTEKYGNLLVVRTYSKSRNMAGARLGYAVGSKELISDIEMIRYSFNPYNLNSLTLAAGAAALSDNDYYEGCWAAIRETREDVKTALRGMGFTVTDSCSNFIFVHHAGFAGPGLYAKLRERGILVRNLGHPRIRDWLRITIGAGEQMRALVSALDAIFREAE